MHRLLKVGEKARIIKTVDVDKEIYLNNSIQPLSCIFINHLSFKDYITEQNLTHYTIKLYNLVIKTKFVNCTVYLLIET